MNAPRLRSYVSSLEKKYRNGTPKNDYVVDITTMNVVDDGQQRMETRHNIQRRSSPIKSRSSASSTVEYICPPGFSNVDQQMSIYRPPATSDLFNHRYQISGLEHLLNMLLNDDEDEKLRKILVQKAFKTLGLKSLPSSEKVHPFIHISDDGMPNITFLYDSPPFTPWKSYIDSLYPQEALNLSRKIYEVLLNPTIFRSPQNMLRNSANRNRQAITNGSIESDSTSSDDLLEDDFVPINNKSNLRRSQRSNRPSKKFLTATDASDTSSNDNFVVSTPKGRVNKTQNDKKAAKKTPAKRVYKKRVSNVVRSQSSTKKQ